MRSVTKTHREVVAVVSWLIDLTSQQPTAGTGHLTIVRAATLRQKFQMNFAILPAHSITEADQPILALTVWHEECGRVTIGVPAAEEDMDSVAG